MIKIFRRGSAPVPALLSYGSSAPVPALLSHGSRATTGGCPYKRNSGVSTIAAIMMIIILGILGTVFVSLLNTEQYGYLKFYEATQSFYNANAGAEWGLKQQAATVSPISFAGGTIDVQVAGSTITAIGVRGSGRRIIQVEIPTTPPSTPEEPIEGCESFMITDNAAYTPYTTTFDNPVGGVGDRVYIKVRSTKLVGCSGGAITLDDAELEIDELKCPNRDFDASNWSCAGPFSDANCVNYYEYTISFNLPSSWSNTSASIDIKLKKGGNEFRGNEVIKIGQGDCSSVKFYSDAGYTNEVSPWEFEKGETYYIRVITPNLNNNAPTNKKELKIEDFYKKDVFKDTGFFTQNGTQSITCGGSTYNYGSYEGNFTVPNSPPPGGSKWKVEPTAGWYYDFEIELETSGGGSCEYKYKDTMKIIANGGGAFGGPLDEVASQASASKGTPGIPDWHGAQGGNDQFILKLFNETSSAVVVTGFSLSCSSGQPNLRHIESRTAANGWTQQKIWDGNKSLPTGQFNTNQGGVNDLTIPANSFIIIDDFHFNSNISAGTFTLIVYFQGGATSTLTFTL